MKNPSFPSRTGLLLPPSLLPVLPMLGVLGVLAVLAVLILHAPLPALGETSDSGRITGRVLGGEQGQDLSGAKVVLIRFLLDAKGSPQGKTVATQFPSRDGAYAFSGVKVEAGAVYQIGATMGDRMAGSKPFAFPGKEREIVLDIRLREPGFSLAGVRIQEGLVAVEPRPGAVWITEVVHLINPGSAAIVKKAPLELIIPQAAEKMEMIRGIDSSGKFEQLGEKLLVYGNLPPGRTTIAFRYTLSALMGSVSLEKRYPHPVDVLSVLTPKETMTLEGEGFTPRDAQRIDGKPFDVWAIEGIETGASVRVRLRGVPVQQQMYLIAIALFLLLSGGVVVWFLRARLSGEAPTGSP